MTKPNCIIRTNAVKQFNSKSSRKQKAILLAILYGLVVVSVVMTLMSNSEFAMFIQVACCCIGVLLIGFATVEFMNSDSNLYNEYIEIRFFDDYMVVDMPYFWEEGYRKINKVEYSKLDEVTYFAKLGRVCIDGEIESYLCQKNDFSDLKDKLILSSIVLSTNDAFDADFLRDFSSACPVKLSVVGV